MRNRPVVTVTRHTLRRPRPGRAGPRRRGGRHAAPPPAGWRCCGTATSPRLSPAERQEVNRLIALLRTARAAAPVPPLRPVAQRRARPAPHGPRGDQARRRARPAALQTRRDKPRRVVLLRGRQRLDGRVRRRRCCASRTPLVSDRARGHRGVQRRDPADPGHAELRLPRPRRGDGRGVRRAIPDWSGGTRLGEELRAFLTCGASAATARRAVVVIAATAGSAVARPARRADGPALAARPPGDLGEPAQGPPAYRAGRPGGCGPPCRYVDDLVAGHSLAAFEELAEGDRRCVTCCRRSVRWWERGAVGLATVVSTSAAAPRPPGAAMAVCADEAAVGSVSGGCVEGAVYELATEVAEPASRSCSVTA